jgi:hypothetical protein
VLSINDRSQPCAGSYGRLGDLLVVSGIWGLKLTSRHLRIFVGVAGVSEGLRVAVDCKVHEDGAEGGVSSIGGHYRT